MFELQIAVAHELQIAQNFNAVGRLVIFFQYVRHLHIRFLRVEPVGNVALQALPVIFLNVERNIFLEDERIYLSVFDKRAFAAGDNLN